MFVLYKDNKPILRGRYWEDLVDFVEELNKKYVDRREFVVKSYDEVLHSWKRR